MKILHVIPSMNPKLGGPTQGVRNYGHVLEFIDSVHRDIVCFDKPEDVNDFVVGRLNVFALGPPHRIWTYHPSLKPWLRKYVGRYDAIIIHGIWLYHSYATISVIEELKNQGRKVPKVFVMTHGMLDPWFQKAKSRRWKAIRNSIYWHLIEKKVINSANGVLFTCQKELELAKTTFNGYSPKAEINVGYGIAPPPVYTEKMKKAFHEQCVEVMDKPYFLFLSRIHPKKGVDLLLKAYRQLLNDKKSTDVVIPELVIAGPGLDEEYGTLMLKYVNEHKELKERVHFVGMLSGNAKWGAIYGCEAFVLPSHQENFGIAVAEALACSKSVLISNQVNIWCEIKSVNAGLVEDDTEEGTYALLSSFMELSDAEKKEMVKQAYFAFSNYFDVRFTAHNLLNAIE